MLIGLQLGFFSGLAIYNGTINLIILILVLSFFLNIEKEGLIISLIMAFVYDFYLYSYFGLAVAAVLIIYFLLIFLKNKISQKPGYFLILFTVFFASILFDLIVLGGFSIKNHYNFFYLLLYHLLPDALINLIIAVPFYIVMRKIISTLKLYRILGTQEKKIIVGI
jgi:cell shape-determining protein MreD